MAAKRKASAMLAVEEEPGDPSDELMFLNLGGGNEVGRSCHIIQYKGKTVMLDAGMHPAYDGLSALPFYDEFDLSTVDILLISHFHIDHAASLPYVLSRTNFRGRVFMTHPTKAIYKWLIQDSVRVSNTSSSHNNTSENARTQVYTEADHLSTFPQIEAIDYYTSHTVSGIRITPYPAGHVLGACMYRVEIAGLNILFTGDYSRENDRHLIPATVPEGVKFDVLITESTYGVSSHVPRQERESALMKSITGILNRGGRALLPVFALGRAQELLLILDEYWARHSEYQKYPIFYASNLARKCMVVYQTYIGAMNENIRRLFRERMLEAESKDGVQAGGPWDFRHIRSLKTLERFDDVGGCVMLASPGMLQNGVSRELLERWAPDPKNGVVITGYSVEGTMAKSLMNEPESIAAVMTGKGASRRGPLQKEGESVMIPRRCSVQEYSFAAHVDGVENREFIEEVDAPIVILVHGEKHNMMRLKSKLLSLNANRKSPLKVFSPPNCEQLKIPFATTKTAKVVGKLASAPPPTLTNHGPIQEPQILSGVLVQNDVKLSLMAPEDLREYAGLTTTVVTCKQRLTLSAAGTELVRWALEGSFGSIDDRSAKREGINAKMNGEMNGHRKNAEEADEEIDRSTSTFVVMGCVNVSIKGLGEIEVEWEGNMMNDGIADAVLAVLYTVESSPAAVKRSSHKHSHGHRHAADKDPSIPQAHNPHACLDSETRFNRFCWFLESQFGSNVSPITTPKLSNPKADIIDKSSASPPPSATELTNGDLSAMEAAELKRLHSMGIPVPGLEIKVDKHVARVWLENLAVECEYGVLRDRVKAVVERAGETVAPLWGNAAMT